MAVAGIAASVVANGDNEVESGDAGAPSQSASCGTLPIAFTPPGDLEGPADGPLPGDTFGLATPLDGQLVQHWTGPAGGVELRWPSQDIVDGAPPEPETAVEGENVATIAPDDPPPPDNGTEYQLTVADMPEGADAGFYSVDVLDDGELGSNPVGFSGVVAAPDLGEGDCGGLRLTVVAERAEAASVLFATSRASLLAALDEPVSAEELAAREAVDILEHEVAFAEWLAAEANRASELGLDPASVPEAMLVAELPPVDPCVVPDDEVPPDAVVTEQISDLGTFVSASEALAAFLARQPSLVQDGYIAHYLPGGTVGFAARNEAGKVTTIVRADLVEGGWTFTSWQDSGCS